MLSKRSFLACGFALALLGACSPPKSAVQSGGSGTSTGKAAIGGPFQLVDQNGQPRDQGVLKGKWTVVYFGYTYCPDACPTMLAALAEAQKTLGPKARDFQVVLISVDPERDTPKLLKTYLDNSAFPTGAVGLTGTPEQIAAAAKAYRVYFKKVPDGDSYVVDHASIAYLMDPKGEFSRPIGGGTSPDDIANIVTEAMRKG